jgi:hypothetical protein
MLAGAVHDVRGRFNHLWALWLLGGRWAIYRRRAAIGACWRGVDLRRYWHILLVASMQGKRPAFRCL